MDIEGATYGQHSVKFNPKCSLELRHEDLNGNESVRFLGFSVAPLRRIQKTHSVTDLKSVKSGIDFPMDILGLNKVYKGTPKKGCS